VSLPLSVQIVSVVVGVAILGAAVWLRRDRGDGIPRGRGVPSSVRAGAFLILLGAVAGAAALRGPAVSTLTLFGEEPVRRGLDRTILEIVEPAPSSWGRLATLLSGPHAQPFAHPWDAPVPVQRPFLHSQHESVACSTCHGVGEEHRVTLIRSARDCQACHHDPRQTLRRYECTDCHGPADMPAPGPVPATLDLSVWDAPRVRELPFDHDVHAERICQDCHTGPVLLAVETECASCHVEHHTREAECSSCHLPAEEAHDVEVHLTCSEAGCHSGERAERPALSRPFCLMCHTDQRDHEPGGECATCHMIPAEPLELAGLRKWLPSRGGVR
jgi:hypothetical protein